MAKAAKAPTKTEVYTAISEATGLTRKDVGAVMDALAEQIEKALGKRGPGAFTIPGLVKITKKEIPARPAEKNWRNPFTGELQDRPAKPASTKVKVLALKKLKDMV